MAIEINGTSVSNVNYNGTSMCSVITKCELNGAGYRSNIVRCFNSDICAYYSCSSGSTCASINARFWIPSPYCTFICYCYLVYTFNSPLKYAWDSGTSLRGQWDLNSSGSITCYNYLTGTWEPKTVSCVAPRILIKGRCAGSCAECCYYLTLDAPAKMNGAYINAGDMQCVAGANANTEYQYGRINVPAAVATCFYYSGMTCTCDCVNYMNPRNICVNYIAQKENCNFTTLASANNPSSTSRDYIAHFNIG